MSRTKTHMNSIIKISNTIRVLGAFVFYIEIYIEKLEYMALERPIVMIDQILAHSFRMMVIGRLKKIIQVRSLMA